ncbi:hypothetical protein ABIE52_006815 [Rhodococcus sp. OAS809]|uniref:hypothetical protein n=1 Tax=Rhodococcus sp. OAS809 TaxID=2663874 RepID=UPI00178ABE73
MVSVTIPESVLQRIGHLIVEGDAFVPGCDRSGKRNPSNTFAFLSPTVLYPVDGTTDRYLIAVYGTQLWTLVGLDYLACHHYCEDTTCVAVRERAAERFAGIPDDGMLFARAQVTPGTDLLPDPTPYLIHIDDQQNFTGTVSLPVEVELFE